MNIFKSIFTHGIDAPYGILTPYMLGWFLVLGFFKILISCVLLNAFLYFGILKFFSAFLPWLQSPYWPHIVICCNIIEALYKPVVIVIGNATKPRVHRWMLKKVGLQENESVLDISNSSGLSFVDIAAKVPDGKVIGLTNWDDEQFETRQEEIYRYAQEHGVTERNITVLDTDPRMLPFANQSFDVTLSSWTISQY